MASSSANLRPPDVASKVAGTDAVATLRLRQGQGVRASSGDRQSNANFEATTSRNSSPIPSEGLSRKRSSGARRREESTSRERYSNGQPRSSANHGKNSRGLEIGAGIPNDTWSLSSLASSFLGNGLLSNSKSRDVEHFTKAQLRRKRNDDRPSKDGKQRAVSAPTSWGPNPESSTTTTMSQSIQDAARRHKREALFANMYAEQNMRGQFKRKTSPGPDENRQSLEPQEDTLVYLHQIKSTDTLAGIMLMYNISSQALHRANRLWPNDSIQMRSKLFLPVDECRTKGKPCERPSVPTKMSATKDEIADGDLLIVDETTTTTTTTTTIRIGPLYSSSRIATAPRPRSLSLEKMTWEHHSFVRIEPLGPVEIVRLPRPQLSHFPPPQNRSALSVPVVQTVQGDIPGYGQMLGDLAKESLEGLEVVGHAIEGFVRRLTVKAEAVMKDDDDLIELTASPRQRARPTDPGTGDIDSVALEPSLLTRQQSSTTKTRGHDSQHKLLRPKSKQNLQRLQSRIRQTEDGRDAQSSKLTS